MATISVAGAVQVFAQGFGAQRSLTYPYLAERVGPLWWMHDAPRRTGSYRSDEWIVHGVPPAQVDEAARTHSTGRFALSVILDPTEAEEEVRAQYRELGYRLMRTELLMVHDLSRIPRPAMPVAIERVMAADLADRLAKVARGRMILPEHFQDGAPIRQYVALEGDDLVGWVRSIQVGDGRTEDATYCANMFVEERHRRRGIASALMSRLLRDDRTAGSKSAVLMASHTGALLYPTLGYQQIGTLLLYTPGKR